MRRDTNSSFLGFAWKGKHFFVTDLLCDRTEKGQSRNERVTAESRRLVQFLTPLLRGRILVHATSGRLVAESMKIVPAKQFLASQPFSSVESAGFAQCPTEILDNDALKFDNKSRLISEPGISTLEDEEQ